MCNPASVNPVEYVINSGKWKSSNSSLIKSIARIPQNTNKNVSLKQKIKNKFDKQFNDAYLAAIIAQKFQLKPNEKILEIGTGSG